MRLGCRARKAGAPRAEALLRWNHPEKGLISPGQFIFIAEERGLIVRIGSWVIGQAARQAAEWRRTCEILVPIAVNVSAVQFRQKDFVEQLTTFARTYGIPPDALELELTESIIMRDAEGTIARLNGLHDMGFRLSIDDFGTGYSSLNYLRRFPTDKIKIDQSFVRDQTGAGIVNAVIGIARNLGLKVVAEGVETEQQLLLLREQNCDQAQGYFFSPPLSAVDFELFVERWCGQDN